MMILGTLQDTGRCCPSAPPRRLLQVVIAIYPTKRCDGRRMWTTLAMVRNMGRNVATLFKAQQAKCRTWMQHRTSFTILSTEKNHDKSTLPSGVHVYSDRIHLQIDNSCVKTARSLKQATLNPCWISQKKSKLLSKTLIPPRRSPSKEFGNDQTSQFPRNVQLIMSWYELTLNKPTILTNFDPPFPFEHNQILCFPAYR